MSTVVFVEMPAFGHVNPSLPLARELVRRGDRVVYYNDVEFQPMVEAAGATFRAYPAGVITSHVIARATQTGDLLRVPRRILRATETLAPFLLERLPVERPDVVVAGLECAVGPHRGALAAAGLRIAADDDPARLG